MLPHLNDAAHSHIHAVQKADVHDRVFRTAVSRCATALHRLPHDLWHLDEAVLHGGRRLQELLPYRAGRGSVCANDVVSGGQHLVNAARVHGLQLIEPGGDFLELRSPLLDLFVSDLKTCHLSERLDVGCRKLCSRVVV